MPLVLKKPFSPLEVRQSARALSGKWGLEARDRAHAKELERHGVVVTDSEDSSYVLHTPSQGETR